MRDFTVLHCTVGGLPMQNITLKPKLNLKNCFIIGTGQEVKKSLRLSIKYLVLEC